MEFEYNGKKITVRDDPLTGDELKASKYYNSVIGRVLKGVKLSEDEQKMDVNELIQNLSEKDPDLFGEYTAEMALIEEFETILLATSLKREDILAMPGSVRKSLFLACEQALGGTARDFFERSGKSSISQNEKIEVNPESLQSRI